MTADEIIEMFTDEINTSDFHVPKFISGVKMADGSKEYIKVLEDETFLLAKQCALLYCQGIIDELKDHWSEDRDGTDNRIAHWKKLKSEIEKK